MCQFYHKRGILFLSCKGSPPRPTNSSTVSNTNSWEGKFWSHFALTTTHLNLSFVKTLREDVSIHSTNLKYRGKSYKIRFISYFIFCSPICPNNCGVVFLWKYILVFEKLFFSFDRSNMQIFALNITRVVWPHVTNKLDLRYFCRHNPLFSHLNLIPYHYWSWLGNTVFIFWQIFLSDILFLRRKVVLKQRQF